MIYKEYGYNNKKTVLFLHGGGLSWWGYQSVADKLSDEYHIILPVLDGHGDSDRKFTSIEDSARHIIEFIKEKFNGHIYMIGGLSLGGQIALEILSQQEDICDFAIIESAAVIPSEFVKRLVKPMIDCSFWLINKTWFSKIQFNYLKIKPDLYEKYYEDSTKISKENMISFLEANSGYHIKKSISQTKAKVLILAGAKEQKQILKSAEQIKKYIPSAQLEVVESLYHGQLSMNCSAKFVSYFNKLIQ